jgi:hypothetical protein
VVAPFDHAYVKGPVPPLATLIDAVPVEDPQEEVVEEEESEIAAGSLMETAKLLTHSISSVTVT